MKKIFLLALIFWVGTLMGQISVNPTLPIIEGYDFTSWGVSLDNRAATLISPIHFVSARHYRPAVGMTVIYHDYENNQYTGTVTGYTIVPNSDIVVGTFENQISNIIKPINIIEGRLDSGTEIISGHKQFNIHVSSVTRYTIDFAKYQTPLLQYSTPLIQSGDSSFPAFVLDEFGNTTIAGTHYRASIGNYALDSPLGVFRDQISNIVSADGYTLGIPEPAHYSLILGLLFLSVMLKRRQ